MRISECGLDPFERDDGIHPHSGHDPDPPYNSYLRSNNLGGDNPWEEWANSASDDNGDLAALGLSFRKFPTPN